jgi:hypothetical protein
MINKGGHSVERVLSHLLGDKVGISFCTPCPKVRIETHDWGGSCGSSTCAGVVVIAVVVVVAAAAAAVVVLVL